VLRVRPRRLQARNCAAYCAMLLERKDDEMVMRLLEVGGEAPDWLLEKVEGDTRRICFHFSEKYTAQQAI
jgi:hypothetical protein